MKQNNLVKVLLPRSLPEAFTYGVPEGMAVNIGDFVEVPLGNKLIEGVVWGYADNCLASSKIKAIIRKLDAVAMPKELMQFIGWVAEYTISPLGNVLKMAMSVPEALVPEKLIDAYELTGVESKKLTASRNAVIDLLNEKSPLTAAEIKAEISIGASVIKGLMDSGIVRKIQIKPPSQEIKIAPWDVEFSDFQQKAADDLRSKVHANKYSATLLDGVTGSGKTEVYFAAVEEAFKDKDAQVLIMLPEIALTSQIVMRFFDKFGFEPLQWHSNISAKQRENNWRDVAAGRARLIIGARSALFLPYKNLCLIVVDEEHDGSYKQEEGVIYHGRDMAVVRANIENIPIVLASATPSIETVENVKAGKYSELKLPSRHGGAVMPQIQLVDMRRENLRAGFWLSNALKKSLSENIASGKQSMLFLNRRGYAPLTLCRNCGYRFKCPDCSSWLVDHRNMAKLMCHHCGYTAHVPDACPECAKEGELVSCGPGVERIAEEVANAFPSARIAMMTSDKMTTTAKATEIIESITSGNVDIIIGTQVIAKGYHFPDLKLVGVIDADLGMEGGDLRASERTYQLLQQVSGRAGREKDRGKVILQSYMPDNMLMKSLVSGSRDDFVKSETESRKRTNMPPYARLAGIIISGKNEREVGAIAKSIVKTAPITKDMQVLGPVPAPLYLLRGNYRYRILVRSARNINIQKWLKALIASVKVPASVKVKVDIDPYSFM